MKKIESIYRIFYALVLFTICFCISLYNPQNPFKSIYAKGDTSVYQYIAKMMWQGSLPYRDIFDHKGPVIYLWNMLGYYLHPMYGQWFIELILLIGSAWFAYTISKKYLSVSMSFLITSIILLFTPYEDTIGNTESLSVFLNFYFLYCVTQFKITPKKSSLTFGCIIALQLFIKPTHAAMSIILSLGLFLKLWHDKNYSQFKNFIICTSLGFISVCSTLLAGLGYFKMLHGFYQDYILFNLQYTSYWRQIYPLTYIINFYLDETVIKLLLGLTGFLTLLGCKQHTLRPIIWMNTITILALIPLIILPHNPAKHYTYMLFPLLMISLILICIYCKKYPISIQVFLAICFIIGLNQPIKHFTEDTQKQQYDVITDTARFLQTQLPLNASFIVLGYDMCRLHLLSNRPHTTRYPMNPMVNRIMPKELFTELNQTKPKFILIRREETPHYINNLKTYWPNFANEYLVVTQNSEYYILLRLTE